jgi:hypothetical protein
VDVHGGWVDVHGDWVDVQAVWLNVQALWVNRCLTAAGWRSNLTGGADLPQVVNKLYELIVAQRR